LDAARRRQQRRWSLWAQRQMMKDFPKLSSVIPYDTSRGSIE